jgi:hypothetical protein
MKKIFIIIVLMLPFVMKAQTKAKFSTFSVPVYSSISNRSCAAAQQICNNFTQQFQFPYTTFDLLQTVATSCASNTLYYYVNFLGAATNGINVAVTGLNAGTAASWEWIGVLPNMSLAVCDQINNFSVPVQSGNFGTTAHTFLASSSGIYVLKVTTNSCVGTINITMNASTRITCQKSMSCSDCVTSFVPNPGKYIISAWVKDEGANPATVTNYTHARIGISFTGSSVTYSHIAPSGAIIDGWQRIEEEITIPSTATALKIDLKAIGGVAYFDDIRFFPVDGSMMSYVYDPISLRLMAELDERNYATLYEYDEEGKLIRVKKETERGVMTIQENRDNIKKN